MQLETELTALRTTELQHKTDPSPALMAQLQTHRQEIQKFMAQDSKKALQWTRQMFYEKSNKADTLLARRRRQRQRSKQITQIQAPDGQLRTLPHQTATVFQDYYASLYISGTHPHAFTHR
ncbi:Hypothetical predicted protein [Pelobates cultripes]|uniref:Uncharacterized protein n=1 Tax=Pelobates cultripes TaxID=61616 RepID=A0AAD1W8E6_PELCU|nr:Hypothetical predicted protein [Pelobates cultripes]